MLKYKRLKTETLTDGEETMAAILAGAAGKNRRIVAISTAPYAKMYLRVYRDADQIVDCASERCTDGSPWITMDLPLAEGQQCTAGFYNDGAVAETAKQITIAYEESA